MSQEVKQTKAEAEDATYTLSIVGEQTHEVCCEYQGLECIIYSASGEAKDVLVSGSVAHCKAANLYIVMLKALRTMLQIDSKLFNLALVNFMKESKENELH